MMSDKHARSQSEETEAKGMPFADCIDQMMSACGQEMKKWMEAWASDMNGAWCDNSLIDDDS
jgi:hypothetical protein